MISKKLDLGEYIIKVNYDKETGDLEVMVMDELGELIESIDIQNDEDESDDNDDGFNLG